ncbi:CPBP family intramembrane metalloprotease [Methanobrevibacter sp.]|uniref:CPBP family intramembrane glutamic endopeptidase n=1 Tax=Methanobrevibacter sp. TaxID=66852 RepID=UPI00257AE59C|nr:CPBP family intramembrane metalloprotease [Methanobrevibacter sp.]MBR2665177.1 CPBP family intramembrane metalloprotease [Methanobrevibacter sp.]
MEVLSADILKQVVLLVILNVFISYGFLYLSHALLNLVPALNFLFGSNTASNSIMALSLVATIIVSPVAEELIFRGIFLNRLNLIIPPLFAVLVSSLLFASLHSYGSIISAFIFAICMALLYLKTENILIPIFAHFLNNLLAEIIVRADVNSLLFTNDVVIGVMSILAAISFVLLFKSIIPELNSIK